MSECKCKSQFELYKKAFELAVVSEEVRQYFLERAEEELEKEHGESCE